MGTKITPVQNSKDCGIIFLLREDYALLWICIVFRGNRSGAGNTGAVFLYSFSNLHCSRSICLILLGGVGRSSGMVPPSSLIVCLTFLPTS